MRSHWDPLTFDPILFHGRDPKQFVKADQHQAINDMKTQKRTVIPARIRYKHGSGYSTGEALMMNLSLTHSWAAAQRWLQQSN